MNHSVFSYCDWLILLSIMSARFILVVACIKIILLFKAKYYFLCVCLPHFLYPFFHYWTAFTFNHHEWCPYQHGRTNVCLWPHLLSWYVHAVSGVSGSCGHSVFNFWKSCRVIAHSGCTNKAEGFPLVHTHWNVFWGGFDPRPLMGMKWYLTVVWVHTFLLILDGASISSDAF